MLSSVHFLLTYQCLYECDHCFLYCSPRSVGTFSLAQLADALDQAKAAGVTSIYVEGGEPFLYYPVMLELLRLAKARGLTVGLISNCYWAVSEPDAEMWLRPLVEIGIDDLSLSDDGFHSDDPSQSPAKIARRAAARLGLPVGAICIESPRPNPQPAISADGAVVGGDVLFKGRAADKLVKGLPRRTVAELDSCPHEELAEPSRVHLDSDGRVFVCQGISIGNIWERPLAQLMAEYDPEKHPIVGPLRRGGPAQLAREMRVTVESGYVDHCHMCFAVRRQLVARFPDWIGPAQLYGD